MSDWVANPIHQLVWICWCGSQKLLVPLYYNEWIIKYIVECIIELFFF